MPTAQKTESIPVSRYLKNGIMPSVDEINEWLIKTTNLRHDAFIEHVGANVKISNPNIERSSCLIELQFQDNIITVFLLNHEGRELQSPESFEKVVPLTGTINRLWKVVENAGDSLEELLVSQMD